MTPPQTPGTKYSWERSDEEIALLIEKVKTELCEKHKLPPDSPKNEHSSKPGKDGLHFENGHYLHSSQYYFAKKYFQSSENCDDLAILLANKLKSLKVQEATLIGFRSYSGMLLRKTEALLESTDYKINYALIEQNDAGEFSWQFMPDFENINRLFMVVLPITCTCSTYIRLRKYLDEQINEYLKIEYKSTKSGFKRGWRVRNTFINILLIQARELEKVDGLVMINENELNQKTKNENREATHDEKKLSKLYSKFNWHSVDKDSIYFKFTPAKESNYTAHPIVKLYSDLHLPEECEFCFPTIDKEKEHSLTQERNIYLTHDNFETPNLLEDFPNFGRQRGIDGLLPVHIAHLIEQSSFRFNTIFRSQQGIPPSHHYGHITVNKASYLNYIRGNTFFRQNREAILKFFDSVLAAILEEKKENEITDIVFITPQHRHNSTFLEEIITYKYKTGNSEVDGALLKKAANGKCAYKISVLRYDSGNEFIENFMRNYEGVIVESKVLIIYFEEVVSAGKTFKLLSNFIKHYRNKANGEKDDSHGFDYIFSLVDRTPYYTREEILKKLKYIDNPTPQRSFISFFKLNVPIIDAAHLGNPLKDNVELLKQMICESHLDVLKKKIGQELSTKNATQLPEDNITNNKAKPLQFFPFEDENEHITPAVYKLYRFFLVDGKLDLLKLYTAHQINLFLHNYDKKLKEAPSLNIEFAEDGLITEIVNYVWSKIEKYNEPFFTSKLSSENRLRKQEKEIVHDTVIKILARHPFTYYKKIYDEIFSYCLKQTEEVRNKLMANDDIPEFYWLRRLKFYIRRLIDLDSSYLISEEFILLLQHLYSNRLNNSSRIERLLQKTSTQIYAHDPNLNLTVQSCDTVMYNNLIYKYNTINSFADFVLYTYKESIFKNHYRAIRLEELLNSEKLLPDIVKGNPASEHELLHQIRDPYYKVTGMLKAENIYLLNQLKELHKKHFTTYLEEVKRSKSKDANTEHEAKELDRKRKAPPIKALEIMDYYFDRQKSDPVIVNAQKFVDHSRFSKTQSNQHYDIKLSISSMIEAAARLSIDNNRAEKSGETVNHDLIKSMRNIIESVVSIMQSGSDRTKTPGRKGSNLGYALCVKYSRQPENERPNARNDKETADQEITEDPVSAISQNTVDNIYVISSDRASTGAHIGKNGLIYNLMTGLYDSREIRAKTVPVNNESQAVHESLEDEYHLLGEQSLLAAMRVNESTVSFNRYYYTPDNKDKAPTEFTELFNNDCRGRNGGHGLHLLTNAKMCLFFRLAELDDKLLFDGKCHLQGKAVLIITSNKPFNKTNYLNFMSNEKVRLLLLLKEELLKYLQKKVESDAFIELKRTLEFRKIMNHMVPNYLKAIEFYLEKPEHNEDDISMIKFLKSTVETHLGSMARITVNKNEKPVKCTKETMRHLVVKMMEAPFLASFCYTPDEYTLDVDGIEDFVCHPLLYKQVFRELIVNIRRASQYLWDEKPEIKIYTENNRIVFRNKYNPAIAILRPTDFKKNGGREMNQIIFDELDIKCKEIAIKPNIYETHITLTPSNDNM